MRLLYFGDRFQYGFHFFGKYLQPGYIDHRFGAAFHLINPSAVLEA